MDNRRLDLSPLDPSLDADRWERMVRSITDRAAPELSRRAAESSPFVMLTQWARPVLAAAAVLVILAGSALAFWSENAANHRASTHDGGVIEALRVAAPAADWLLEDRGPVLEELLLAQEGDERP